MAIGPGAAGRQVPTEAQQRRFLGRLAQLACCNNCSCWHSAWEFAQSGWTGAGVAGAARSQAEDAGKRSL